MATLESAKAKWARKMAIAGPKWKAGVYDKGDDYCEGIGRFLGISPAYCKMNQGESYTAGVDAVTAESFAAAVKGKEDRWADKLKEAFTGPR